MVWYRKRNKTMKGNKTPWHRTSIHYPKAQRDVIWRLAADKGVTPSALLREIIADYLKALGYGDGVEAGVSGQ